MLCPIIWNFLITRSSVSGCIIDQAVHHNHISSAQPIYHLIYCYLDLLCKDTVVGICLSAQLKHFGLAFHHHCKTSHSTMPNILQLLFLCQTLATFILDHTYQYPRLTLLSCHFDYTVCLLHVVIVEACLNPLTVYLCV